MARDVLAPAATGTDQGEAVPRTHLRALAEAGLMRLFCPPAVDSATRFAVFEELAAACGVTFFVWVQHHAPVRMLGASENTALRDRWLHRLGDGAVLGGVAFAHLRRPGPPAVTARPVDGGFVLEGEAPYVTSWGLAELFAVGARVDDERIVFLAVPAGSDGLHPSEPLRLLAMQASATVRLRFEAAFVPDDALIVEHKVADWQRRDRVATAQPNPAAFGVAAASIGLLAEVDPDAAQALDGERLDCRDQSLAAAPADIEKLVELRAWSLELAVRSAYALVVATGGRAMDLAHPAQRLLREATFYAIQAQTGALRAATMRRLTRPR